MLKNQPTQKQKITESIIIHPTYFPSIAHYVAMANADAVVFEVEDNFQKQTYRNRTYMYGANGKLMLNVPVRHSKKDAHQKYKDIKIANETAWQRLHFKSLESAYRASPFFEYYEDELRPIFEKKYTFLIDLNFDTIEVMNDCLQLEVSTSKTTAYNEIINDATDFRKLVEAKKEPAYHYFETYTQVFEAKHGFIPNLSILDLLFNEGTNALSYLERQTIR